MMLSRTILNVNKTSKTSLLPSLYFSHKWYGSKGESSDSDNEQNKKVHKKNEETISRLNLLLQQMVEDGTSKKTLDLAKPKGRNARNEANTKSVQAEPVEKKIVTAVKNVADEIGGNTKRTELELLSKLLSPAKADGNSNITASLSDIFKGMTIDRDTKSTSTSRAHQVRQMLRRSEQQNANVNDKQKFQGRKPENRFAIDEAPLERVDIFGSQPLGIFTSPPDSYIDKPNETWQKLEERELRLAITHPPSNYFQEMILWTEQGKLWKFPIDNEQGMEDEQNIYFTEHVFMEQHLDSWCPQKGPVRHFMELVCVGLSKNHYMSVKDKREHIEWYKNYFEDKMQLLKDVGAVSSSDFKQIESK